MAAGGYIEFGRVNGEYSDKPFLNGLVHMLKIAFSSFLFNLCRQLGSRQSSWRL